MKEKMCRCLRRALNKVFGVRWIAGKIDYLKSLGGEVNIFIWYVFLIIIAGQAPIVLNLLNASWNSAGLMGSIKEMQSNGDFIMCSVSILSSGLFFLAKEYISQETISNRRHKSILIIISISSLLISSYFYMNLKYGSALNSSARSYWHWGLYVVSMIMSFILWLVEEGQNSAKEAIDNLNKNAKDLTVKSEGINAVEEVSL